MNNSISITKSSSEIIVLLIIYFITLIFIGIIKSNILIDILPAELVNTAKISSYVSIVISSIISAIVIGLIIGMIFFLNIIFDININENNLVSSFDNPVLVFIFFELIKYTLAYFMLDNEISRISYSDNFLEEIKLTSWYLYDNTIKYLMIFISTITYCYTLYIREKEIKISILIIFSIVLLTGFYISTIDFFDNISHSIF